MRDPWFPPISLGQASADPPGLQDRDVESLTLVAFQEAQRLGHTWVGEEHLLIALAKDPQHSRARRALAACGLHEAAVTEGVENIEYLPDPGSLAAGERPQPNPHFYTLHGRAEGFAIAAGSDHPRPEHILLAMLWDEESVVNALLRSIDREPAHLQSALAALGVRVPPRAP